MRAVGCRKEKRGYSRTIESRKLSIIWIEWIWIQCYYWNSLLNLIYLWNAWHFLQLPFSAPVCFAVSPREYCRHTCEMHMTANIISTPCIRAAVKWFTHFIANIRETEIFISNRCFCKAKTTWQHLECNKIRELNILCVCVFMCPRYYYLSALISYRPRKGIPSVDETRRQWIFGLLIIAHDIRTISKVFLFFDLRMECVEDFFAERRFFHDDDDGFRMFQFRHNQRHG